MLGGKDMNAASELVGHCEVVPRFRIILLAKNKHESIPDSIRKWGHDIHEMRGIQCGQAKKE